MKNAWPWRFEMCAQAVRKYHLAMSCFRTSNGKVDKFQKGLKSFVSALRPDYVNPSTMTPHMKRDQLATAPTALAPGSQ